MHQATRHYHGYFAAFFGQNGLKIMIRTFAHIPEMRQEHQEEDYQVNC